MLSYFKWRMTRRAVLRICLSGGTEEREYEAYQQSHGHRRTGDVCAFG